MNVSIAWCTWQLYFCRRTSGCPIWPWGRKCHDLSIIRGSDWNVVLEETMDIKEEQKQIIWRFYIHKELQGTQAKILFLRFHETTHDQARTYRFTLPGKWPVSEHRQVSLETGSKWDISSTARHWISANVLLATRVDKCVYEPDNGTGFLTIPFTLLTYYSAFSFPLHPLEFESLLL